MIGCDSQCGNNDEGKIGLYKAIAAGCVHVDKFVSNGPCDKTCCHQILFVRSLVC